MKTKLKKRVTQENLKVLSFEGTPELLEKLRLLLETKSDDLEEYLEMKMISEKLGAELKERKLLESSFKSWSSKSSMQDSEGIANIDKFEDMQSQQFSKIQSELSVLDERVNKMAYLLAAWGPVNPGPLKDSIILSCSYFHCFSISWQKILNDRGHIGLCKSCKKSNKK
jgi:hypothetical protein